MYVCMYVCMYVTECSCTVCVCLFQNSSVLASLPTRTLESLLAARTVARREELEHSMITIIARAIVIVIVIVIIIIITIIAAAIAATAIAMSCETRGATRNARHDS